MGTYEDRDGERHHGHRLLFTNVPAEHSELLDQDIEEEERARPREREWLNTTWHELADGCQFVGFSERADHWVKMRDDQTYIVGFEPDGSVEKGFGVRIISEDLEISPEDRTITIVVNPLTAEAQAQDGYQEIPISREENEFQK